MNVLVYKASVPGSTSTQHEADGVSCQDPGQTGKVGVTIWTLLKHALVQLSLKNKPIYKTYIFAHWVTAAHVRLNTLLWLLAPVWANSFWRTLGGGRTGDGVWRSSSACSATRPSLWVVGHPPCAATPAASEPELHCSPTSAPTAGGQEAEGRCINTVTVKKLVKCFRYSCSFCSKNLHCRLSRVGLLI